MLMYEYIILDFIQMHFRSEFWDYFWLMVTHLGDYGVLWIILCILMLSEGSTRRLGMVVLVGLLLNVLVVNLFLKPMVARERPFEVLMVIDLLIPMPGDYSFPSGHSSAAFVMVGAMLGYGRKLWGVFLVIAIGIAFSRLYLYVHFPSDVFFGALIGFLLGIMGELLVSRLDWYGCFRRIKFYEKEDVL